MKTKSLSLLLAISFLSSCSIESKKSIPSSVEAPACYDALIKIVESSPRFNQLTAGLNEAIIQNGGTSFGLRLENAPDTTIIAGLSWSKNYIISLHESYPDKITVITRFIFDPESEKLFERDEALDSTILLSYDKNLLDNFKQICY